MPRASRADLPLKLCVPKTVTVILGQEEWIPSEFRCRPHKHIWAKVELKTKYYMVHTLTYM